MEYTGVAKKVFEKNGRHSILCDDDQWYGHGYKAPPCADNDIVKFQYEDNGKYHNIVEGTVKRKDNPNPPVEDEYSKKKSGGGGKGGYNAGEAKLRKEYWDAKEIRDIAKDKTISFNGAINVATNLVTNAIAHDLIKLGGKAGAKYDAYFALVMEEAETVFRVLQKVPENYDAIMSNGNIKLDDVPEDLLPDAPADVDSDDWDITDDDDGFS